MKIAILASDDRSFRPVMARSLASMLYDLSCEVLWLDHGLFLMTSLVAQCRKDSGVLAMAIHRLRLARRRFKMRTLLKDCDAVAVIGHLPHAFMEQYPIEALRRVIPHTPIVLYANYYLPTRGRWLKFLKEGSPQHGVPHGGNHGMERYDWYLATSVASEYTLMSVPQPCSCIGIRIRDESLFPDQRGEFRALIDFERPDHLHERAIQVQALHDVGVKYEVLSGSYDLTAIREIYRRTSIYFVAHRESFGIPICEVQACGAKIFTPYANWCPSHWIKEDLKVPGPGRLGSNFVVYDNRLQILKERIDETRRTFDAHANVAEFMRSNATLATGDLGSLREFIGRLARGEIRADSHADYAPLNDLVMRHNDNSPY